MKLSKESVIGVIGAGTMGQGIAQIAAQAGHRALLYDAEDSRAAAAKEKIARIFDRLIEKSRMQPAEKDAVLDRIAIVDRLEKLAPAALVVEAVVEKLEVKRDLFIQLEAICGERAILATNTSSLSVTAVAAPLERPERVVGMHFFNPAPLMPLVEVISGVATSPDVAKTIFETAEAWGKKPAHATSSPGFIVNRVARPFYAEGLRVIEEQGSDVATVDACMREAGGFRMGPFELMDLIGNDVNQAVTESVFAAFNYDPRYRPSTLQSELVAAGRLGRKSGKGWYDHSADAEPPIPATAPKGRTPSAAVLMRGASIGGVADYWDALLDRLGQSGAEFREESSDSTFPAIDLGECRLMPADGRHAEAMAAEAGKPVLQFDLALDWSSVSRLAVAQSSGMTKQQAGKAHGFFQVAGIALSPLADIPGLIVTRTAAMLINEAVDALYKSVSDAAGIDRAMKGGVNYPLGPLEWADRLGVDRVRTILDNLFDTYREERYRASALWRRLPADHRFHGNAGP